MVSTVTDQGIPKVFLHIGEPKTGSTFLQQVMWGNRAALAAQGVVLAGHHPQDHFRATQDLRGLQKLASDPNGSWTGEWDILARQARQAPGTAVISHELFAAADDEHARKAVASLAPAEVHLVITVRDMAGLLTAEWQESVKQRYPGEWQNWLADTIDRESVAPDRRRCWFWRVHDTLAILQIWSRYIPAERIHVLTTPPRGAPPGLLWERFAGLLGLDPASADISLARANASLGVTEAEFLRRLNIAMPAEVPDWFYMWTVKEGLAHTALAGRQSGGRLVLPPERHAWAAEYADKLIAALAGTGYDMIGDLEELRPAPQAAGAKAPASPSDSELLDIAIESAAALVLGQYRKEFPAEAPGAGGTLADRVTARVRSSPRVKRALRDLSGRYPAVRSARVLAWRVLERSRPGSRS